MSTQEHTPGPWEFSSDGIWAVSPFNARVKIATVTFGSLPSNGINPVANGHVLGAAAELLAALRECAGYIISPLRMTSDVDEAARRAAIYGRASAAIAKAEASTAIENTLPQDD